ncbi:MAG: dihydrodipicolinate synthase family protein, partial [Candidatus Eremiobacteraeota bacterium]|nr:dihydrodipicolinate synthase family protein [Candidatus Eremiobacteraeota bacterium]
CITATANALAPTIVQLSAGLETPSAARLQDAARDRRAVFEAFSTIAALKEFTALRTGDGRWRNVLPPLTTLSAGETAALRDRLAALNCLPDSRARRRSR